MTILLAWRDAFFLLLIVFSLRLGLCAAKGRHNPCLAASSEVCKAQGLKEVARLGNFFGGTAHFQRFQSCVGEPKPQACPCDAPRGRAPKLLPRQRRDNASENERSAYAGIEVISKSLGESGAPAAPRGA